TESDIEDYSFSESQKEAIELVRDLLKNSSFEKQGDLDEALFDVKDDSELSTGKFFETIYKPILGKEEGPRLSRLILAIDQEKTVKILEKTLK
ncbi:MAG: hypothetical protein ABEI78_02460, partial [Candidatus Nanohaloarchaea archaeon]